MQDPVCGFKHVVDVLTCLQKPEALREINIPERVECEEVQPERHIQGNGPAGGALTKFLHEDGDGVVDAGLEVLDRRLGVQSRDVALQPGVVVDVLEREQVIQAFSVVQRPCWLVEIGLPPCQL